MLATFIGGGLEGGGALTGAGGGGCRTCFALDGCLVGNGGAVL